jgi:hypothetical protein
LSHDHAGRVYAQTGNELERVATQFLLHPQLEVTLKEKRHRQPREGQRGEHRDRGAGEQPQTE